MRPSTKLMTVVLLAGTTIGAGTAFSIHLRHQSTSPRATLAQAVIPTSIERATLDPSDGAGVIDSSWTHWAPLTADGQ